MLRTERLLLCLTAATWLGSIETSLAQTTAAALPKEAATSNAAAPVLVEVRRIWNHAPHNAFTDLVRWNGRFYCGFREGEGHAGDRGKLRIIESVDGRAWKSTVLLEHPVYDLRDAALCVTPGERLMVLGGAQTNRDGRRKTGTFVSFSSDGRRFDEPRIVIEPGRWLWRVTWLGNQALGVSYGDSPALGSSSLLRTRDGIAYETLVQNLLETPGWETEARIRFDENDTAWCLHRRDGKPATAQLGSAEPPWTEWTWTDLGKRLGGPNLFQLPDGSWIAAGRLYDGGARTSILSVDLEAGSMEEKLTLPSKGDTSYPGLVWHEGELWMSYYSSHEDRTSIYLARVRFPSISN